MRFFRIKQKGINSINNNTFSLILCTIFFIIGYLGILHHEMWRDELRPWQIARTSQSVLDIFHAIKYDGHPSLWYLGLYIITRFTSNPFAMQVYHLLIATGVIFVFVCLSPFTKFQKILFSFSYYPFYEYAIKPRNYSLGILFIFLFCVFYSRRFKNYFILSIILFLLCQTSALGLILAICFGTTLFVDALLGFQEFKILLEARSIILGLLVFIGGTIVFFSNAACRTLFRKR